MSSPLVSVIMNCFNGEKYLKRSLDSLVAQKYENFELIFWDNLSNDNSKKIFQSYNDKRFKYFMSEKHKILYDARNDALKRCNGKYISFLDTDDFWMNNKLSSQISVIESNKEIGLIYANYTIHNRNKIFFKKKTLKTKFFKSGKITKHLIKNYYIGLLTVLIRKEFMKGDLEFFNSKYNLLSDFDYILRFSKKYEIDYIKENVAVYNQHDNQLQKKYIQNQAKQFETWFNYNLDNGNLFESNYDLNNLINKIKFLKFSSKIISEKKLSYIRELVFFPNNLYKVKLFLLLLFPERIHKKLFSFT
jgi:glycosyltransferase involved in cell wall biosynthesis